MLQSRQAFLRVQTLSASLHTSSNRPAAKGIKIHNPSADILPFKGKNWLKKPVKLRLEEGKTYKWCSCGLGVDQPWCDGQCKMEGQVCRPVDFSVEKTGDYHMCNCKQTEKRPLCDGTHKTIDQTPKNANALIGVAHAPLSPVYEVGATAWKLGFRPKDGHIK